METMISCSAYVHVLTSDENNAQQILCNLRKSNGHEAGLPRPGPVYIGEIGTELGFNFGSRNSDNALYGLCEASEAGVL